MIFNKASHVFLAFTLWATSSLSLATVVQMQTEFGEIDVNLFDETTPVTVANFLNYVANGDYNNTLVHRSISEFIIQGGGYYLDDSINEELDEAFILTSINRQATIINEPVYSNVRGTIAMAKLSCSPNSATSEWFINLADNSANLDTQNSGFTVFGQITQSSLAMLDAIAVLPTYNLGSPLTSTPLTQTYTGDVTTLAKEHFVFIDAMTIVDTQINSADTLTPALNTLIATSNNNDCEANNNSAGGGSVNGVLLMMCLLVGLGRRKTHGIT